MLGSVRARVRHQRVRNGSTGQCVIQKKQQHSPKKNLKKTVVRHAKSERYERCMCVGERREGLVSLYLVVVFFKQILT